MKRTPKKRVLVVDDDARLRTLLFCAVREAGFECRASGSYQATLTLLQTFEPDIVVMDYQLGDGCGHDLLAALRERSVLPAVIVVSGEAEATDAFRLAQQGARFFVAKPFTPEALTQLLHAANSGPVDIAPVIRSVVGHVSVHEAQQTLRETMIREALNKAGGSRTGAARLLRVSRQLFQHMLRSLDDPSTGRVVAAPAAWPRVDRALPR